MPRSAHAIGMPLCGGVWRYCAPERKMMVPRVNCSCPAAELMYSKGRDALLITDRGCFSVAVYTIQCRCLQSSTHTVDWVLEGYQPAISGSRGKVYIERSIVEEWTSSYWADPRYSPDHKVSAFFSKLRHRGVPAEYLPGRSLRGELVRNAVHFLSAARLKSKEVGGNDGLGSPWQRANVCPACVVTAPMGDKVFDGDSWSINERSSKSAESAVPPCNGAVESMALSSPPSPAFIDSSSSHIPVLRPLQYSFQYRRGIQLLADGTFKQKLRERGASGVTSLFSGMLNVKLSPLLEQRRKDNATKATRESVSSACSNSHVAGGDGAPGGGSGGKMALCGMLLCTCKHGFAFYAEDIQSGEKVCAYVASWCGI
jgi:hypothetical protein